MAFITVTYPPKYPLTDSEKKWLEEREAYHVLPKQSNYINLMSYCLHLWSEWEN